MSTDPSPEEGDAIDVTITNRGGEVVVTRPDRSYDFLFSAVPPLEDGGCAEVTVTVTKTWYSTSGSLETLTVTPSSDVSTSHESDPPAGSDTARASSRRSRSSVDDSLREIADDLIGDEGLDVTDEEESIVGAARRKAREQGRDPAIDPRLNDLE